MDKVIAVTGAGQGLGYCIAKRHLQMNDIVYAYDLIITEELMNLKNESDLLKVCQCDIGSTKSVNEAMGEILKSEKKVDILYNVAGIFRFEDKVGLVDTDLDLCLNMYNVNAVGALRVCKALWPLFKSKTVIVNISSEAGSIGASQRKGEYSYCMSKAALNMGAKILSNELAQQNVRVINIHPGWMRTKMGGPQAFASPDSVSPEESARDIVSIALDIDNIPKDWMFITHKKEVLPW